LAIGLGHWAWLRGLAAAFGYGRYAGGRQKRPGKNLSGRFFTIKPDNSQYFAQSLKIQQTVLVTKQA
jgi:hypothetical protein